MAKYQQYQLLIKGEMVELWNRDLRFMHIGQLAADASSVDCLRDFVDDANRGAESAAYDKAIDDAAERATDEAFKLTPAALAHGLVRDAIGVLAGEHLPPGGSQHHRVPFVLLHLAEALGCLNEVLVYEFHTTPQAQRPVPPQPIEEAIAEARGLTPEVADGLTPEVAEE